MNVRLIEQEGYLMLEYTSKYATGGIPVSNPQELVSAIEDVCGKGSYCLYQAKGDKFPKAVDYFISRNINFPKITYWQQGVKTSVIEQAREVAEKVWGDIPEMEIGWLENKCKSYIEDLNLGEQEYDTPCPPENEETQTFNDDIVR